MSFSHFNVQLDGRVRQERTINDALTVASGQIFISIQDWIRHTANLKSGKTAHITYGFTEVVIEPVWNDRK